MPGVDHHLGPVADRVEDPGEQLERHRGPVELPAAVVGEHDRVGAGVHGGDRVGHRQHPLDHDRTLPLLLEPGDVGRSQRLLAQRVGHAPAGVVRALGEGREPQRLGGQDVAHPARSPGHVGEGPQGQGRRDREAVAAVLPLRAAQRGVDGDHQPPRSPTPAPAGGARGSRRGPSSGRAGTSSARPAPPRRRPGWRSWRTSRACTAARRPRPTRRPRTRRSGARAGCSRSVRARSGRSPGGRGSWWTCPGRPRSRTPRAAAPGRRTPRGCGASCARSRRRSRRSPSPPAAPGGAPRGPGRRRTRSARDVVRRGRGTTAG